MPKHSTTDPAPTHPAIISSAGYDIARVSASDHTMPALMLAFDGWLRANKIKYRRRYSIRFVDSDRNLPLAG